MNSTLKVPEYEYIVVQRTAASPSSVESKESSRSADKRSDGSLASTLGLGSPPIGGMLNRTTNRLAGEAKAARHSLPPPLQTTPPRKMRLRFANTSATVASTTVGELLLACGGICTVANTTVVSMHASVRVKQIIVWPAASASAPDTPILFWGAGTTNQVMDGQKIESVPQGISVSAPVSFVPPAKSLASDWVSAGAASSVLFGYACPVGSIIDVMVEATLANLVTPVSGTVVAGTLGAVYYLPLDGASTNTYRALGVPTTA